MIYYPETDQSDCSKMVGYVLSILSHSFFVIIMLGSVVKGMCGWDFPA